MIAMTSEGEQMANPVQSAELILKLYELRRDPVMREARDWFIREFFPADIIDLFEALKGSHNSHVRMVIGYWDMAATLVNHGAIDESMFWDANPEAFAVFAKIEHIIPDLREANGLPEYLHHFESLMRRAPKSAERIELLRHRYRAVAAELASRGD
jgi:hypothetical protein